MARLARIGGGFGLIIAGVVMLVIPGPGILTIIGGLALLSRDVAWAGRLSDWMKQRFASAVNRENDASESETL